MREREREKERRTEKQPADESLVHSNRDYTPSVRLTTVLQPPRPQKPLHCWRLATLNGFCQDGGCVSSVSSSLPILHSGPHKRSFMHDNKATLLLGFVISHLSAHPPAAQRAEPKAESNAEGFTHAQSAHSFLHLSWQVW